MPSAPDHTAQGVIPFGPFRLSAAERLIERAGEPLALGGRPMDILIALVERAGDVVSQRDLIDRVWPNVTVDDSNLRSHVGALRRALNDGQDGVRYVVNVAGRGYCFVSPTTRSPPHEATPVPAGPASAVPVIHPDGEHSDLAIGDLAREADVLTADATGRAALPEETNLIDDQNRIIIRQVLDEIVPHDVTQRFRVPWATAKNSLLAPGPVTRARSA
jgi:DNA-binding winged helix-turn-helix (wHTH) protein